MYFYPRVLATTFGTMSAVAIVRFTSLEELLKANTGLVLAIQLCFSALAILLLVLTVGRVTSRR